MNERKNGYISPEDWDAADSLPLDEETVARLRPAREEQPDIVVNIGAGGCRKPWGRPPAPTGTATYRTTIAPGES